MVWLETFLSTQIIYIYFFFRSMQDYFSNKFCTLNKSVMDRDQRCQEDISRCLRA